MNTPHRTLRMLLGVLLPASLLAAALLPLLLWAERLPEPLASHWGIDGHPNGSMQRARLVLLVLLFAGAAAATMCVFAQRRDARRGELSAPLALGAFVAGLIALMSWATASANLDAATWQQARHLGILAILATLALCAALAAIVARLGMQLESRDSAAARSDLPHAGVNPGSRAVWVSSARAGWALPLTLASLAAAVLASRAMGTAAIGLVGVGLVGLAFTSIRVTVDHRGLGIAYGIFSWPRQRLPLTDIQQATALHVEPMACGGWGYRGSLRMFKRAAVVLRRGEGMQLKLSGDRTFVVTVDNAAEGAGLINDLVDAGVGAE